MSIYGKDFAALYDQKWSFWGKKVWPVLSENVRWRCPQGRTWLDLCCGGGSLLKLVARAGYLAVGVDASPHQLRYARRNCPSAELHRGDIGNFRLDRRFDVVTCMFDSLNYLTKKADLLGALRNARRHIRPGGLFAFDVNTYQGLQRNWNNRTSTIRQRDRITILETRFDEKRAMGRLLITGFVHRGKAWRKFQERHVERAYSEAEIEKILRRLGFSFRKMDGHRFTRPRKQSARLLYICRVPPE